MVLRLRTDAPDFGEEFKRLLGSKREQSVDVGEVVKAIIADVRDRGDAAVIEYTQRFDHLELTPETLRLSDEAIDAAIAGIPEEQMKALKLAAERIESYHRRQLPSDARYTDTCGAELGHRWTAIEAVGLYTPGGQASYPSSMLMNAIPAKVAGVPRIAMC